MALIICPECGKQYSDKAEKCPQCGHLNIPTEKQCPECGIMIPFDSKTCPNCGCPFDESMNDSQKVEVTNINLSSMDAQKKKNIVRASVVILILIILSVASIFIIKKIRNDKAIKAAEEQRIQEEKEAQKASEEYGENLNTICAEIISSAAEVEDAGGLIHDVWYDAIYDKYHEETKEYVEDADDFNDALSNLFSDLTFKGKLSSISSDQDYIDEMMKKMQNPPEEYAEAYEQLKSLYDEYNKFSNLVQNPTGSLSSYTSDFNDYDSGVLNEFDKMKLYLD